MATAAIPIVTPLIGLAASSLFGIGGARRAAKAKADSQIASEHGVLDATQRGTDRVDNTITNAGNNLTSANTVGQAKVGEATGTANNTLQQGFEGQVNNLNPYLAGGQTGINALTNYATTRPDFSFNPSDLQNDPGYQFQLGQGTAAVNNSASARGLLQSGNTLQDLTKFGQGLAGTYYNDAFNRALSTFSTNQNSTLANLSTLAGIGLNANSQFGQASENNSNQQAGNTLKAGYFGGTNDIDLSKFFSQLSLGGNEFNADLGLRGSTTAGNFATGAGQSTAEGILGGTNSLTNGINGAANILGSGKFVDWLGKILHGGSQSSGGYVDPSGVIT